MEPGFSSCFVILPPLTGDNSVIFGKNSGESNREVQELVYEPKKQYKNGESLKCTYLEVKQVEETYATILSKPAWMWGCEMGANDQGVAIGNALVVTKLSYSQPKTLLGTDLVRLALERSKTAEEAVDVITNLLAEFDQCSHYPDASPDITYQNSFLIADAKEAWVLETVGKQWVAQKISSGHKSIANRLSIETQFDKSSPDVCSFAKEKGFWSGEGDFNFAAAFNISAEDKKFLSGQELLNKYTKNNEFKVKDMFAILRDKESGICCSSQISASQVSVLSKKRPNCHWFTATPDPSISVFKPFIFTPNVKMSHYSKCPEEGDRRHVLYNLHAAATANSSNKVTPLLQDMERNCVEEVEKFLAGYEEGQSLSEFDELLKDIIETEVKFYK